jgi:hypothetical protein
VTRGAIGIEDLFPSSNIGSKHRTSRSNRNCSSYSTCLGTLVVISRSSTSHKP